VPVDVLRCPDCGATLRSVKGIPPASCNFCHAVLRFASGQASAPQGMEDVVELIRKGQKINAIKLYRERTGARLAEAKDAVEEIEKGLNP